MKKDWVGTWFHLIEKRGIPIHVVLGSCEPGSDQITKFKDYSHADYDGVGLVVEHLREQGLKPQVPTLPDIYRRSWRTLFAGLIANLRFVPVFSAKWKVMDYSPTRPKEYGLFAHQVLSREDSQQIFAASKIAGVSVNAQLLWALDKTLREHWVPDSGPFFWMLPINMRVDSQKKTDTSNHASWIWVDTLGAHSAIQIQNQIKKRLSDGFHWGAWVALNIGKLIRIRGMNFLLNQAEKINERWVGTFSNLGSWNIDSDPLVVIIPTPPTTPISVGCISINKRLGLSLHVHPNLKVNQLQLDQWLQAWVKSAST